MRLMQDTKGGVVLSPDDLKHQQILLSNEEYHKLKFAAHTAQMGIGRFHKQLLLQALDDYLQSVSAAASPSRFTQINNSRLRRDN